MKSASGQGGAPAGTLFFVLVLGVVLAPIPFASNREWAWSALALWSGLLAMGWALAALFGRLPVSRLPSRVAVLGFGLVCAWAWLQTWPGLPASWAHPLWSLAAAVEGQPAGVATVSLAPDDGITALMRYLAYGGVFLVAFQLCREPTRAVGLLRWLAVAGLLLAAYGLFAYFSRQDSLFGLWPFEYKPVVRGSFVNRNAFATWLGLAMLCGVALAWQRFAPRRNPAYQLPTKDRARRLEAFLVRAWRPLVMLMVMAAALFLTGSRGGFAATLAGLGLMLLALSSRKAGAVGFRRGAIIVFGLGVLAVFWITSAGLLQRLDRSGADLASRIEAYELAADGVEDNPWLGFGYGTFADSFRLYRDERLHGHFDMAHNTYLENAFELGWPVALAQFIVIGALFIVCLNGWRRREGEGVFPALGMAATVLVAVHSLVDFSLQMPATAIAYAAIMGAACARSRPGPIYSRRRR